MSQCIYVRADGVIFYFALKRQWGVLKRYSEDLEQVRIKISVRSLAAEYISFNLSAVMHADDVAADNM